MKSSGINIWKEEMPGNDKHKKAAMNGANLFAGIRIFGLDFKKKLTDTGFWFGFLVDLDLKTII